MPVLSLKLSTKREAWNDQETERDSRHFAC